MHWLTTTFIAALIASFAMQWWLSLRQARYVRLNRDQVPTPFVAQVSKAEHTKAADYTIAKQWIHRVDLIVDSVLLVIFTLGGGIDYFGRVWQQTGMGQPWLGTAIILSIVFVQVLVGLPLAIYQTFGVEARFGFNRTTPRTFVTDLLKQVVVSLLLGVPLLATVLFLMNRAGSVWWLYAWLILAIFNVVIQWAYPAVIAPLFNKFSPLTNESLRLRVQALLDRCGFKSQGIFVMDGSKRSAHGNAYFTGFGRNKRVVFYDTLIDSLTPGEIEGVLAHELGHFRLHHIRSRLILSLVVSFGALALLGALYQWSDFYAALGVTTHSPESALLLFMLALGPFTFWLTPRGAWWSRKHEFEADEFAARYANNHELAEALTKLYRDNASTLTPDRLHSAFYDSHPPAMIRIAHLQSLGASA
jgi:STE24 endopeptidase